MVANCNVDVVAKQNDYLMTKFCYWIESDAVIACMVRCSTAVGHASEVETVVSTVALPTSPMRSSFPAVISDADVVPEFASYG